MIYIIFRPIKWNWIIPCGTPAVSRQHCGAVFGESLIHPSSIVFVLIRDLGELEPITAAFGLRRGYTLGRSAEPIADNSIWMICGRKTHFEIAPELSLAAVRGCLLHPFCQSSCQCNLRLLQAHQWVTKSIVLPSLYLDAIITHVRPKQPIKNVGSN